MTHVHVKDDGGHEAIVGLDQKGHAKSDGTPLGEFAIHQLNHRGLKPEHGERLLNSIVERLDSATLVSAHHCNKPECLAHHH